ncbi:hypothetical protein BDY19DRAFT_996864 [Irpex rosettiformis]|uniref:Uncharacterized protein n=1 Tax=Irpex rosettiformis TaxID=378272 RepID=A0ACB8TTH0_9APHY|nr:hypothetical protein BDY19DRAFT_996864 [Irpex rosettiformis]
MKKLTFPALEDVLVSNSGCSEFAHDEVCRRFNELLSLEVTNTDRFLEALRHYKAVLSGRFVLSMLDPMQREGFHSITVFVAHEEFDNFVEFMEEYEEGSVERELDEICGLHADGFTKAVYMVCARDTFHIIQSASSSPLFPIPYFYSTHLMNYVAHDRICVGYPRFTFLRQGLEVFSTPFATSFTVKSRNMMFPFAEGCSPHLACGACARTFQDEFACTMDLDTMLPGDYGHLLWKLGGAVCCPTCKSTHRFVATS